jgi:hypothetical protein
MRELPYADFGHFAPRQIVNFLVYALTVTLHFCTNDSTSVPSAWPRVLLAFKAVTATSAALTDRFELFGSVGQDFAGWGDDESRCSLLLIKQHPVPTVCRSNRSRTKAAMPAGPTGGRLRPIGDL